MSTPEEQLDAAVRERLRARDTAAAITAIEGLLAGVVESVEAIRRQLALLSVAASEQRRDAWADQWPGDE